MHCRSYSLTVTNNQFGLCKIICGKHRSLHTAKYTHCAGVHTYPGTTEELLKPILEKSGLVCGIDFYLAFSPERVDPGNLIYKTKNTPKVVGGVTAKCTDIAATMYEMVLEAPMHRVSSPAVAEMENLKILIEM